MNKVKFSQLFLKKLVPMIIIMLFLSFLAFSEGIGYKVINESSETITIYFGDIDVRMGPYDANIAVFIRRLTVNVSLNPFLYPISYILGDGKNSNTHEKFYHPLSPDKGYDIKDDAKFGAVIPEVLKNSPYLLFIGFLIVLFTEKMFHKLRQTRLA